MGSPTGEDDSPWENEESDSYEKRRLRTHIARLELIPHAVRHDFGWLQSRPNHCKAAARCIMQIHTVGYATLGSGYDAEHFKPYSMAEATHFGIPKSSLQQLLENDGEWNVRAKWRADCTPLYRHHDHDDIHCGENAEHLNRMIIHAGFPAMMSHIKTVWSHFLRDEDAGYEFDGLCIDPYGQCRSVALARIVCFCLGKCGVQVLETKHLSRSKWQWQCCTGDCTHCTNNPMSDEKQAVLARAYNIWLSI